MTVESKAPVPARRDPAQSPTVLGSTPVRRHVALVTVVAVVMSVLAALGQHAVPVSPWSTALPFLLAVAFLLAELALLEVSTTRVTIGIPLIEVPLAAALLLVSFPAAGAAVTVAVVVRSVKLRMPPLVSLFNVASGVLEVAVAYLVLTSLEGRLDSERDLVLLFVALVSSSLVGFVNSQMLAVAVAGSIRGRGGRALAVPSLTMAVVGPLVVVLGVQLLRAGPTGWVPLGGMLLVFALLYRAFSVLLRERKDLDLVQQISSLVPEPGESWAPMADLVLRQFSAGRAVVRAPDTGTPTIAGEPLPADLVEVYAAPDELVAAAASSATLFTTSADSQPVRAALTRRRLPEVLVAPLGAARGAGSIELHDRRNQLRGFGPRDVALLDTLARHVATAVDNRRLLDELRDAAYHDRLTGLSNRLGFVERAAARAAVPPVGPATPGAGTAVLLVELGALGPVTDALGHGWGDRLVLRASRRVQESVDRATGPGTVLGRVAGDTFAVLLHGLDAARCEEVAAQLAADLAVPYPMDEFTAEASVAIGVAVRLPLARGVAERGTPAEALQQVLQHAEVAVQAARASGQPVRRYHEGMGQRFLRRFQLVNQFRAAMADGQVEVHLQPKIALADGSVAGAEALLRWSHPEFGPVNPEELVHVLEATGLMDELTRFVLDRALGLCRAHLDRGVRLALAVNVSVRNLLAPDFPEVVAQALARHRLGADLLTLEITETSVMGDAERTLPALRVLHEMGVTLSVDDFGTGYSSLAYLRRLPVHEIKIDKSFVLGMGTDLGDLAVVRSIIDLGRSLGLRVVAEGVESEVVRDQLAEMGCDVVQGYLVARPMEPARFEVWLHARTVGPGLDPTGGVRAAGTRAAGSRTVGTRTAGSPGAGGVAPPRPGGP